MEIENRVAIVTGASSGIGAATARALARRGAKVVLAARRADELQAQADAIAALGGVAVPIPADVTDTYQVDLLVKATEATFGAPEILVNSAGVNWRLPFSETGTGDLVRAVQTNLLGAMFMTRAALPGMLLGGRGAIVSVGSLSGRVAMDPVYSASKYGLRGFSLSLRRQLVRSPVSVSLVSPGNIRTAMTEHVPGVLPGPDKVAEVICELVRKPRRDVVVPRRLYALAWLEQAAPAVTDLAHRWRRWAPAEEKR